MTQDIKRIIVEITNKVNTNYEERIIKLFENSIFLETDEKILFEWLTKVNESI